MRAQHLIHYIGVLRDAGMPVERELERSRLPVLLEQAPNDYISIPLAIDWIWRASRETSLMELGFLAGRAASLDKLDPNVQRAVIWAPTGLARIVALSRFVHRENSALQITTRRDGANLRVICAMPALQTHPFAGFAEWIAIPAVIDILRSSAGPGWCPIEITFMARGCPSDAAREAYGNTRILTGQPCCSVLFSATAAARLVKDSLPDPHPLPDPRADHGGVARKPPPPPPGFADAWDFVATLRAIIRPYIAQGHPPLSLVAEIAGISERGLQRKLAHSGLRYSQIVQETRFLIAAALLADSNLNIADIALAAGYENAPHFSRAFRRITGMTPRDYRRARCAPAAV